MKEYNLHSQHSENICAKLILIL